MTTHLRIYDSGHVTLTDEATGQILEDIHVSDVRAALQVVADYLENAHTKLLEEHDNTPRD